MPRDKHHHQKKHKSHIIIFFHQSHMKRSITFSIVFCEGVVALKEEIERRKCHPCNAQQFHYRRLNERIARSQIGQVANPRHHRGVHRSSSHDERFIVSEKQLVIHGFFREMECEHSFSKR